jgi:hypothetical protein
MKPREAEVSRPAPIDDALRVVRELLGDRDASKVKVEVTRGGTFRVEAETADGAKVVTHQWGTGRGR